METIVRAGSYIQTFMGVRFYPLDPRPEEILIEDIAHALSHICRFTGHVLTFYSVAQHSVLTSQRVPQEHALAALLHDASEAYLSDIAKPVKCLPALREYGSIEDDVMHVVAQKFGFDYPLSTPVAEADCRMLFTEKRDLLGPMDWGYEIEPYPESIYPLLPWQAKRLFLSRFYELTKV